jgi:hypothetical protein
MVPLSSGTTVFLRGEPVIEGAETIGALVRIDPARRLPTRSPRRSTVAAPCRRAARSRFGWQSLTSTELGVADLVASGLTNR